MKIISNNKHNPYSINSKSRFLFEKTFIIESKIFDIKYYLYEANLAPSLSLEDAAIHYLTIGQYSDISPSPLLNHEKYRKCHNYTIANRGLSPFVHSLIHGFFRERIIGIHIHAYYIDVLEELITATLTIKDKKTYYISVHKAEDILVAQSILDKYDICERHKAYIKKSQNVGRNFGSMLLDFRQELLKHSIILHLHTKKSLRTGSEQDAWRKHAWYHICGSKKISSDIIQAFNNNSNLGLVGSIASSDYSSYWWQRWLSVGHLLPAYFNKISMPFYQKKGILHFPIGGMFWAKVDAIRPLLETEWHLQDFHQEPSPDDGTVAHVIERSLGIICKNQGYIYREAYADNDASHLVDPITLIDDYKNIVSILNENPMEKVISYDFFDTLFTRVCFSPSDVHDYVGFLLSQKYNIQGGSFREFRGKAESIARKKNPLGEVDIFEIYDSFSETSSWTEEIIESALRLELETEKRILIPRHDIIKHAKKAKRNNVKLTIVSDTYLPSSFLKEILRKNNLDNLFDEIHVSCEIGKRKDWGNMWNEILNKEKASIYEGSYLHIGDNEQSDIQQTVTRGIRSIGVLNPVDILDTYGFSGPKNWKTGNTKWIEGVSLGPIISKYANSPYLKSNFLIEEAKDFGYCIFGPLLFGFNSWLISSAANTNHPLDTYSFLSRDGYLLKNLYDEIKKLSPSINMPKSSYHMISRQAAFACLFDSPDSITDPNRIDLLIKSGKFKGSIQKFFESRMGYHLSNKYSNIIDDIDSSRELICDILLKESRNIQLYCNNIKNNYLGYLSQIGFDSERTQIVDVGYSGTTQKLIQLLLEKQIHGKYMVLNNNSKSIDMYGIGGSADAFYGDRRIPTSKMGYIEAYSLFIEACLTAFHGKVVSYDNRFNPIEESFKESKERHVFINDVYQGVLNYSHMMIKSYGSEICLAPFTGDDCILPFIDFVEGKIKLSKNLAKKFLIEDDFCGNGIINAMDIYGLKT